MSDDAEPFDEREVWAEVMRAQALAVTPSPARFLILYEDYDGLGLPVLSRFVDEPDDASAERVVEREQLAWIGALANDLGMPNGVPTGVAMERAEALGFSISFGGPVSFDREDVAGAPGARAREIGRARVKLWRTFLRRPAGART